MDSSYQISQELPRHPDATQANLLLPPIRQLGAKFNTLAQDAAPTNDPLGIGFVTTFAGLSATPSGLTMAGANDIRMARALSGGTISTIAFQCTTSSGNVSVAVYRKASNTSGRTAVPVTRIATSGAVACPAAGFAAVALTASVTVLPGDYLALSADNTTAAFWALNGIATNLLLGLDHGATNSHPAPVTVSTFATGARVPLLIGY